MHGPAPQSGGRSGWLSVVALVLVVVALGAGAYQVLGGGGPSLPNAVTETNRIEVRYGTSAAVAAASGRSHATFARSVTVVNASGAELTAGKDYRWNATTGRLTWFDTPNTTAGSFVRVTYRYSPQQPTPPGGDGAGGPSLPGVLIVGVVALLLVGAVAAYLRQGLGHAPSRHGGR